MKLYLAYTVGPTPGALSLVRYSIARVSVFEKSLEVTRIEQPFSNHNGAHLEFGPDGYLYIGVGDGGALETLESRAADDTLLGTILRIDVSQAPYLIPEITPVGRDGRDEIYAWGHVTHGDFI